MNYFAKYSYFFIKTIL